MKNEKKISKKQKITPALTLLEKSISEWWKNINKLISVYLWGIVFGFIPVAFIAIFVGVLGLLEGDTVSTVALQAFLDLAIVGALLFLMYFLIRAYLSLFLLIKNNYKGKPWDIFKESRKYFWSYFGLVLLTTVFILLWALLLIIPGIIFSVLYSMAVYVFFFEDKKGMAAVRRSIELVKKHWWAVFGRYLLLGLILYAFMAIISIPVLFFQEGSTPFTLWNILTQIISFLIGPISLIFGYHVYKDLIKIKG